MFQTKYKQQQDNAQVQILSHLDLDALLCERYGERYRRYRQDWTQSMRFMTVPDFPLTLEIENLNHCNFSCHMCAFASTSLHPDKPHKKENKRFMDIGLFKKAVDEGARHGLPAMTHGVLCEPLLHPDIVEMVSYASDHGVMDQRVGSNGSRLTKEMSGALIDAGLARLEISLDGFNEETFRMVRKGREANYGRIIANIKDFIEVRERKNSRFPLLRLSMLRLNVNKDQVGAFLDYWKDYADYFSIQEPINVKLDLKRTALEFESPHDKEDFRCDKQHQRIFLRHDGTMLPCFHIHAWEAFSLGNLKEKTLLDAWNTGTMDHLRALHRNGDYHKNPICHNCVRCTSQAS